MCSFVPCSRKNWSAVTADQRQSRQQFPDNLLHLRAQLRRWPRQETEDYQVFLRSRSRQRGSFKLTRPSTPALMAALRLSGSVFLCSDSRNRFASACHLEQLRGGS